MEDVVTTTYTYASSVQIPTVDLSPFIYGGDSSRREKVMDAVFDACTNFGVFEIENHGLPLDMCDRIIELSNMFFKYSLKEKKGFTYADHTMAGHGFYKCPIDAHHHYEYVLMHSPKTPYNGVPPIPRDYRKVYKDVYTNFLKTAQILEKIINDCLGLPPNVLKKYNNERSSDCLLAMNYPRSGPTNNIGIYNHQDTNLFTIVLQDKICGLEVLIDGKWIPIKPTKGKLVVLIGDLIQVLSNKKFISVTHRALRQKGKNRHAIDFCYTIDGKKWVEPLGELTQDIGVDPKYEGFFYNDYMNAKKIEEKFNIEGYEI